MELVRFVDDAFPLLISVSAPVFNDAEVRSMIEGFERYFQRGERYAVLSVNTRGAPPPAQQQRRMIADWANQARVKALTKKLCIGTATVAENAIMRASLSIVMAFWKAPSPLKVVPSFEAGLDYCLKRIEEQRLALPRSPEVVRREMIARLKDTV